MLYEGLKPAHCGDIRGKVKTDCGRCSQPVVWTWWEQGNVVESLCSMKKGFTEWSWQKSQVMLHEKLQHFLNKECPYCPMQYTAFFLLSPLPPLSEMKGGKGEGADDKKKHREEENGEGKQHRISKSF